LHTPVILAIDIGSSSVRAALFDHAAKPLTGTTARREWSFASTPEGGSEMEAVAAFAIVGEVIDKVLAKASRRDVEITHVAMCSFWHSLIGVDSRGKPTTPVLGWADTRSRNYSSELKRKFDESEVHNRTGAHFHSSFWPAKLLWQRHEHPKAFARTTKWMGFGDYAALRLTGASVASISMASATGIFDQRKCDWDRELPHYLKIKRTQLPEVARAGASFQFTRKLLIRWPQLSTAVLLPSIGDGAADHIGSCGVGKSRASLMVGTSAAMRVAYEGSPAQRVPGGLWCYRIDDKRVILGGALSDGGNLYEWCRHRFKLSKNVEDEIRRRDPSRPLPTVLPFFHGERSTGYDEDARGSIVDLLPTHDGVDVLHAAMFAVAGRLAEVNTQLRKVARIEKIVASGGALRKSPLWREMISEAVGRALDLTTSNESALFGTVLLALERIDNS
jgi:gluconokinase